MHIFVDFMKESLKGIPIQNFYPPDDIIFVKIDKETGLLATKDCPQKNIIFEAFKKGTEPREYTNIRPQKGSDFLPTALAGDTETLLRNAY